MSAKDKGLTQTRPTVSDKVVGNLIHRVLLRAHFARKLAGPLPVGYRRCRLGQVDVQILYPSATRLGQRGKYARAGAASGLANYAKMPRWLFVPLIVRNHHALFNAPPLSPSGDGWPLVLFSHGLGGNADIYTSQCAHLASLGYVVVAIEHADGSGSFATDASGAPVPHRGFKGEYSHENVVAFRAPFLEQRVAELRGVLDALQARCA
jgi:hypothetical protein